MSDITFTIDGTTYRSEPGRTILAAAKANGVYIPTLCNYEGLKPVGTCRICTVRVGGRYMAACTSILAAGMEIENIVADLEDMRRSIVEMLFVEGNHLCPSCEKSGNCELQALGYRYRIMVPRFPYQFPRREIESVAPKILMDRNRCVLCLRCVRALESEDGRKIFFPVNRGHEKKIGVDAALASELSEEAARRAMDICPVGSILRKEVGFAVPIGQRRFDGSPIGSDVDGDIPR